MSRTIWTPQGLEAARRLRYTITIPSAALHSLTEGYILDYCRYQFRGSAKTQGLEMHLDDLEIHTTEDPMLGGTRALVRWQPSSEEVVLLYGPADGKTLSVEGLSGPNPAIHIPRVNVSASYSPGVPDFPDFPDLFPHLVYVPFGWEPEYRRWVYSYQEESST